jgi:hypothetical protein
MNPRRLHLSVSSILLIVALAACALSPTIAPSGSAGSTAASPTETTGSSAASGGCTNPYYPVPSGASWSYASSGGNLGAYTYTRMITASNDTGFTSSDQFSSGVSYVIKWNCQDGNLAALDAGSRSFSMATSKVKMTSDSITSDGYDIPASFETGKAWTDKVTVSGTVESNGKKETSQILNQSSCTAGGADTITVPAGTFSTVKATCSKNVVVSAIIQGKSTQLGANQESITSWYSQGVGFVKSVATGGSNNETIVLTQYKMP